MKKALILFVIIFVLTALIPLISIVQSNKQDKQNELVTIFSSSIISIRTDEYNYPF